MFILLYFMSLWFWQVRDKNPTNKINCCNITFHKVKKKKTKNKKHKVLKSLSLSFFFWLRILNLFLPGKSHGQRSLMGYRPWGRTRVGHDLVNKQQQNMVTLRVNDFDRNLLFPTSISPLPPKSCWFSNYFLKRGGSFRYYFKILLLYFGFSGDSDGKESACNAGDLSLSSGLGRFPGGGNGNPLQYSCLENSMDRGVW